MQSAEVNNMPFSAEATGCVDFVLPVGQISKSLVEIALSYRKARKVDG
jgi:chemotaxis response regulator CheB